MVDACGSDGKSQDMDHLGDGVYASHDGGQIWLRANDHRSPPLIALEPSVVRALVDYAKRIGMTL